MLTSFFGKSNPINYVLLGMLLFLGYSFFLLSQTVFIISLENIAKHLALMLLLVFEMLLLDFIVRKNKVNKNNTFAILLFTFLMLLVTPVFNSGSIIISNLFILMAIRRTLPLTTEKNIEKKILDAAVFTTVASFFYFWALLFFVVLYIGIIRKTTAEFRYLLIPLVGFLGTFLIATTFYFLWQDSFAWFYEWKQPIALDFSAYNPFSILIPVAVLLALFIWMGANRITTVSTLSKKEKPSAASILLIAVVAIVMAFFSPEKTGAELLFLLAPVAMITANYIENTVSKERKIFCEILLWGILGIAVVLPFV